MKKRTYLTALLSMLLVLPCLAQKKQHGKASYYSKKSTGARTASGQKLHHDSLTCAHRFYPFGTKLKVTNLNNDKSVIVKVIDRGPFGRGRIIDLSWAAAKAIGMLDQGVATVKVEPIENPIPYRPEDSKLPIIDFEMAEIEYNSNWKFQNEHEKNIGKEISSTEHPLKIGKHQKIQEKHTKDPTKKEGTNGAKIENKETRKEGLNSVKKGNNPTKKEVNNTSKKASPTPEKKESESMMDKIKKWGAEIF